MYFLSAGVFENFRQIENLRIAHNEIEELTPFTSTRLGTLRELDLSHNNLQSISPQDAFSKMHRLKVLSMERNSLEEVGRAEIIFCIQHMSRFSLSFISLSLCSSFTLMQFPINWKL